MAGDESLPCLGGYFIGKPCGLAVGLSAAGGRFNLVGGQVAKPSLRFVQCAHLVRVIGQTKLEHGLEEGASKIWRFAELMAGVRLRSERPKRAFLSSLGENVGDGIDTVLFIVHSEDEQARDEVGLRIGLLLAVKTSLVDDEGHDATRIPDDEVVVELSSGGRTIEEKGNVRNLRVRGLASEVCESFVERIA